MARLAAEGKQQGWWQSYELEFATYVGLEAAATSLSDFHSITVPGLLQTPEYARTMHEADFAEYTPERIEEHVEVRMRRQTLLTREDSPLQLSTILDEAVLHRAVGGTAVMRAQLDRLIEAAKLPNVTIQVIPYITGAHPAMDSMFGILDFGNTAPSVVYVEGLMGFIYIEKPEDINRYRKVFEHLRSVALAPQESTELMAKVRAQYKGATLDAPRDTVGF
jgi:hypothetical protein